MNRWIAAACVAMVMGCSAANEGTGSGSDALGSGHGQCAQRHGSYLVKSTMRTGTCGKGIESVVNIDKQPVAVDAPCTGKITYTGDNCEVTVNSDCPADVVEAGARAVAAAHAKWSLDATSGTVVEDLTVTSAGGQLLCHGTYDLTYQRQ